MVVILYVTRSFAVYVEIYNGGSHHDMLLGYDERKRRMRYKSCEAPRFSISKFSVCANYPNTARV